MIAMSGPAVAAGSWAAGAGLGTSGVGAEIAYRVSPKVVARADFDYFKYSGDIQGEFLTYQGHLKLVTGGLFVDFHPLKNPWMLSAGAYIGTRSAQAEPTLEAVNRIGGSTFLRDEVGTIQGKLKLDPFAPFIGVGWNNTFYNKHWGIKALAGAAFSKLPRVTLTRTGGIELPPETAQRLAAALGIEEGNIARNADVLTPYPVVQLGLTYRFQ